MAQRVEMNWTNLLSSSRENTVQPDGRARSEFERDFDRVVFSTAFRRLHDKTQVFPLPENDHVHSRLTHSLEVSCVGRSLGSLAATRLSIGKDARDVGDIVAAACLAHDIGNPPFGHSGEAALQAWFTGRGSPSLNGLTPRQRLEFEKFEGNAQGFRVVTHLEMVLSPGGLSLTDAVLGTYCKYPRTSDSGRGAGGKSTAKHGINESELERFGQIAGRLGLMQVEDNRWARHPLAFLVEAADDICYRILDFEDGFLLGYLEFQLAFDLLDAVARQGGSAPASGERDATEPYRQKGIIKQLRADAIGVLVGQAAEKFVEHEAEMRRGLFDQEIVSSIRATPDLAEIKNATMKHCYQAADVLQIELAGYEVIGAFLDLALGDRSAKEREKFLGLLPGTPPQKGGRYSELQRVTDHIAGMTDSYAVNLFRRVRGVALPGASPRRA